MKNWRDVKIKEQLKKRYKSVVPTVRRIARLHGYGLGVHGSMKRDLDLIAVPWVKRPKSPETMVIAIEKALVKKPYRHTRKYWKEDGLSANKPHGRLAYSIPIAFLSNDFENPTLRHAYIDLSVIPPKTK